MLSGEGDTLVGAQLNPDLRGEIVTWPIISRLRISSEHPSFYVSGGDEEKRFTLIGRFKLNFQPYKF